MIGRLKLNYSLISETKIGSSFPSARFHIRFYEIRNSRDGDKSEGALTEHVKSVIITKRHECVQSTIFVKY